jgi:hypothetical protein
MKFPFIAFALIISLAISRLQAAAEPARANDLFARENLVAWCIVPFDAKKRTPRQRVQMLSDLKIKKFAYDWRAEHLPTFDEELALLKQHDIQLTAVWFPADLDRDARLLLQTIAKHQLTPQLWVTLQANDPAKAAAIIKPIALEAAKINCKVALYNHGGWFGEPENQISIINMLKSDGISNVGIAYNLHHGHDHLERFSQLLKKTKPHLLCLNLNGMTQNGDKLGKKILPIAQGELDKSILKTIRDSGYSGPIGILNHTDEDAEGRLLDNIDGLNWLLPQLDGVPPNLPAPKPRTYAPAK